MSDEPQPVVEQTPAEAKMQTLKILAINLRHAKKQEESTKANRIAVEEAIAALIPGKEIGQITERLPDGSGIVVTRGFNYKADLGKVEAVLVPYDEWAAPIESKTTYKLDVKGYEWFKENQPEIFQQLAEHVTVTPKKVAIELKDPKGE